jgi:alkylresorcinol/alkylpyrone synthase
LPPNAYPQSQITEMITPMVTADSSRQAVMRRMHASSRVDTRHLVQELSGYRVSQSFTETNGIFIDVATNLAEEALGKALAASGVVAADIDFIVFTSVTGISAPSIDALLVPRLGLRADVKRVPMFGLGCVAGAAGLARVHDYLLGHPNEVAVLISVELCSLTVQKDDDSMANIVASGLFGDGAAAVVVLGDERAKSASGLGIDIVDTRSRLYADTTDVLGFNPGETGFKIILTAGVADVIEQNFGADMAGFLGDNGLVTDDIGAWVAHPGGPRVLEAFSESLDLPEGSLRISWESLARVGNLSSASVLHILADTIAEGRSLPGQYGMLFALGPGVCAELVLLRWAQNEEVAA